MIDFYYWPTPNGWKVAIMLEECGLDYRMIPVHPNRWRRNPGLSSGVGKQLTRRLFGRANVYQCFPPLVFHGGHPSVMNPSARAARSLDNRQLRAAASGGF